VARGVFDPSKGGKATTTQPSVSAWVGLLVMAIVTVLLLALAAYQVHFTHKKAVDRADAAALYSDDGTGDGTTTV
jgi:hypothetical protein